jgi:hypothetical protein
MQDRQSTYNVTLKWVTYRLLQWKRNEYCYYIFWHYLIYGKIFGKRVIEHKMCVSIFSTTFVWNISKNNSTRNGHKYTWVFMWRTCYSCTILIKLELYRQIFQTIQIKFHENPSGHSRVVPYTDKQADIDMTKLVTALRNFANALRTTLRRKQGQTRHIYCSIHVKLT